MKIRNLALAFILMLTSVSGMATTNLSAKNELIKTQADLTDLEAQLTYQQRIKTAGYIGIVVSSVATSAGVILGLFEAFGTGGVNVVVQLIGPKAPMLKESMTLPNILTYGGLAGAVTSGFVIYIQAEKIDTIKEQIKKTKAQIAATIEGMN